LQSHDKKTWYDCGWLLVGSPKSNLEANKYEIVEVFRGHGVHLADAD